jgi:hypothetical protein
VNWGSLLFGSLANFVIPFFLFFVSKRHRALSLPSSAESYYSFILLIADLGEGDRISLRTLHSVSRRVSSLDRTPSETASPSHVHVPSPPATIIITNVDEPLRDSDEEKGDIKLTEPEVNDQNGSSSKALRLNTSVVSVSHTSDLDGQAKASGGLTPIDTFTDILDHQSPPTSQIKRRRGHSRGEESVISERGSVLDVGPTSIPDDELDHDGTQLSHRSIRSETLNSTSSRRGSNHSRTNTESQSSTEALFHAIPESKWVRPVILAIVGFVVMTVMVLGNIIYTYGSSYQIS